MEKTAAEIKWGQNVYSSPRGKMAASIALLRGNSVEPLKIKNIHMSLKILIAHHKKHKNEQRIAIY